MSSFRAVCEMRLKNPKQELVESHGLFRVSYLLILRPFGLPLVKKRKSLKSNYPANFQNWKPKGLEDLKIRGIG